MIETMDPVKREVRRSIDALEPSRSFQLSFCNTEKLALAPAGGLRSVPHDIKARVFPWSVRRLEYLLADIVTVAGLSQTISFDKLRWTGAVRDYRAAMDADAQRRKLGLSDVQWAEISRKIKMLAEGRSEGAQE